MTDTEVLEGADGMRLVADCLGPVDGPPALLLHGMGQTRQSWRAAVTRLADQGWRAHAVDLRGHGDSVWPEESAYEYEDFGNDVIAMCERFDAAPLVVGASMGGIAALTAQRTMIEQLFCGLVLVDIAPDVDMEGGRRILSFMSSAPNGYADLEDAANAIAAFRGRSSAGSTEGLTRVLRQHDDGRWHWHWDPRMLDNRRPWAHDNDAAEAYGQRLRSIMTDGVEKLRVPTLLIRGGSSDVVSIEAAEKLCAMMPNASFVDVADAGHMVAGDRNDVFAAAVVDFAAPLLGGA